MPALGLIEGRDAHQAVHADFTLQKSEGVFAVHREGRGLESCFFARLVVVEHGLKPAPLGPSQVHAQKHVGPILGLGAAGSGMNGDDGVARVVLAREQRLGFKPVEQVTEHADFALQVGIDIFAFFGEVEVGGDIVAAAREVGIGLEHMLQPLLFAHYLLRSLRIRPQVRVGGLLFNFG